MDYLLGEGRMGLYFLPESPETPNFREERKPEWDCSKPWDLLSAKVTAFLAACALISALSAASFS